jgi:multidrug resistance efflux pump
VAEVHVRLGDKVAQGAPLFRLDSSRQEAEAETARRKIAEVDAALVVARVDIQTNDAKILEAGSSLEQALDELRTKQELKARNSGTVTDREIERLENLVAGRQAAVTAATAAREAAQTRITVLLPAERASAQAALAKAEIEVGKTVVRAGFPGHIEQFALQVGDVVNPFMRPAGILIPQDAGRKALQAGFNQVEAQVLKVGMIAEVTCISKPWTIIPMVVTDVQDFISR